MKKISLFLFWVWLVITLSGCSSSTNEESSLPPSTGSSSVSWVAIVEAWEAPQELIDLNQPLTNQDLHPFLETYFKDSLSCEEKTPSKVFIDESFVSFRPFNHYLVKVYLARYQQSTNWEIVLCEDSEESLVVVKNIEGLDVNYVFTGGISSNPEILHLLDTLQFENSTMGQALEYFNSL